ncbi:MAG: ABC transporter permease [Betaproteobacteria bacterium]|nr:ABC transporter permease [Betaproteobacteria bacterium]
MLAIPWRWVVPATIVCIILAAALLADVLAPYDPNHQDLGNTLVAPTLSHPMGTDGLGRDVLSRVMHGARVSLIVGAGAVALAAAIGVLLGIASAMLSGWTGEAIMRTTDLFLALPAVLIALAVAATIGPSIVNVIVIIGGIYWAQFARMTRGEALSIRERDYVQAAYAIGCGSSRILAQHILPNLMNTVIVLATLQFANAILLESTLSFLGVGVPPPTPTWGIMAAEGRPYVELAWWAVTFPGLAIMLLVLSINVLGDVLRDRLDPKFNRQA